MQLLAFYYISCFLVMRSSAKNFLQSYKVIVLLKKRNGRDGTTEKGRIQKRNLK